MTWAETHTSKCPIIFENRLQQTIFVVNVAKRASGLLTTYCTYCFGRVSVRLGLDASVRAGVVVGVVVVVGGGGVGGGALALLLQQVLAHEALLDRLEVEALEFLRQEVLAVARLVRAVHVAVT